MRPVVDPEGVEVSHVIATSQPEGKNIIEIGCGHGSLTYQYAGLPSKVVGIDPAFSELLLAKGTQSEAANTVHFACAKGEVMPFPDKSFDIALFSSSL